MFIAVIECGRSIHRLEWFLDSQRFTLSQNSAKDTEWTDLRMFLLTNDAISAFAESKLSLNLPPQSVFDISPKGLLPRLGHLDRLFRRLRMFLRRIPTTIPGRLLGIVSSLQLVAANFLTRKATAAASVIRLDLPLDELNVNDVDAFIVDSPQGFKITRVIEIDQPIYVL